jgi:hypothetical protein
MNNRRDISKSQSQQTDRDSTVGGKRRRAGRPRLEESERRMGRIGVPVNKREEEVITERAATHNMSPAVFLRKLGVGCRLPQPVPRINFLAYRRFGRAAAHFNRLCKLIESGQQVEIGLDFAQQMLDELQAIRRLLITGKTDVRENNDR